MKILSNLECLKMSERIRIRLENRFFPTGSIKNWNVLEKLFSEVSQCQKSKFQLEKSNIFQVKSNYETERGTPKVAHYARERLFLLKLGCFGLKKQSRIVPKNTKNTKGGSWDFLNLFEHKYFV